MQSNVKYRVNRRGQLVFEVALTVTEMITINICGLCNFCVAATETIAECENEALSASDTVGECHVLACFPASVDGGWADLEIAKEGQLWAILAIYQSWCEMVPMRVKKE